ncbi:EAL domain-containing protein [Pseudoalteromonas sp. Scap03]|uniref:EAL domain-containing protein n=1 Tax=unclassified Pseudoalteromonas TaxID=194690 RepID=UPI0015BC8974|nr:MULTISPECIES: EAL domain-containing protein [unclassified Pseudoalteromonas]NWL14497.1 EAL domain-containing protein [Pseudoalteromonas sp. Scap03]QLE82506.1 EAL domain-containing protein [Pseudoalteromonas sp. Scap25]QLE90448.1 EAL domain-containing protein [Pseudoalteromonas sp. Scap06]
MEFKTLRYHAIAVVILIFIFFIISTLATNFVMPSRYTIDKITPVYLDHAYYIDKSKTQNFAEVMSNKAQFTEQEFNDIPWSFQQQNYWLRLDLENKSSKEEDVVAHFDNPMVDHLTIYRLNSNNQLLETYKLGDKEPRLTLFKYSVPHIRFKLDGQSKQQLVIKIDTVGISKTPIHLYRHTVFVDLVRSQTGIWGIFAGVLLMASLYNLLLYFGIKERVYLVYIGYIISAIALMGTVLGFGFYLWPLEWQLFIHEKVIVVNYTMAIFTLAFCTLFLRYHKDGCWRYKLSIGLLRLMLVLGILSFFIPENIAAPIFFVILGSQYIVCFILIYNKLRSGFRWAKFYVFSWVPLIIGAAIQPLELTGVISYSFSIRHAFLVAILCEIVLMAMALADRIRYQREQVLYHATHTQQTKLLNSAKLKYAFMALKAQQRSTTLCLVKIRHFNSLNTIITSSQGYELIKHVAHELECKLSFEREFFHLNNGINQPAKIADLGSGVFACISTKKQSQHTFEELLKQILNKLPKTYQIKGLDLQLNYSVGISGYGKRDDFEFWLKRGYLALHDAKHNLSKVSSSLAHDNFTMDVALAAKLQQAIREDQLALYYQPQVSLEECSIHGAEALLRWPDADFKNISIEKLIILAEHTGIINELTIWVIEQACKDIAKLASDDISNHSISINLSAKNLAITNLTEKVENILIKYQVAPHLLKFELTESAFVENQDALVTLVEELATLGVKVVLDDFGTGYSSLSYLVNYHFSELKVDKSFVFDLTDNRAHQVIVQTAIDMAHNLGLTITIEGVETQEVHQLLTAMNADRTQGYLYAKALSYDNYLDFLKSQYSLKMLNSPF